MDWVQWLALVGGLVAAVVAAVAFVLGRRDVARTLAASVYVIIPKFRYGRDPTVPAFTTYRVVNDGPAPALQVGVSAWEWGRRRSTWRFRRHEHWMMSRRIEPGAVFSTIEPASSTKEHDLQGVTSYAWGGENPPVMLVFRDGQGRRWVRWPDGKLTKLYPSAYYFQERRWRLQREARAASVERRFQELYAEKAERKADAEEQ
jgi:hypothetical protein